MSILSVFLGGLHVSIPLYSHAHVMLVYLVGQLLHHITQHFIWLAWQRLVDIEERILKKLPRRWSIPRINCEHFIANFLHLVFQLLFRGAGRHGRFGDCRLRKAWQTAGIAVTIPQVAVLVEELVD